MIRSMTGFGRAEYNDGKRNITVEIRAVNHRYSDITVKMPRRYQFLEERIKKAVREFARRGKIDVFITVDNFSDSDVSISLNEALARQYIRNLNHLQERFGLAGEITLEMLAEMPEVLKQNAGVEDEEELAHSVLRPVREAAENLREMREVEGKELAEDLLKRGAVIRNLDEEIEKKAEDVPRLYGEKLRERIRELLGSDMEVPEEKLAVEVAFFADKCNITEEIVRLKSHTEQLKKIITESTGECGKKLDFLVQEMNREANTIGSKANDLGITSLMLQIKSEVEKIREQVQNIE